MGVDEETVAILPEIRFADNVLNPWREELPKIFRTLNLVPNQTVLDIPCGQGGVSVHLAKEYGVSVDGYDLLKGYVDNANDYATEQKVSGLCKFYTDDIRNVIDKSDEHDLLLWIAPPHLWSNYNQTIENLRKCVKDKGYIVIADAYLYTDKLKSEHPEYETFAETSRAVTEHGDTIAELIDYKESLWAKNYQEEREAIVRAINSSSNPTEKEALEKYLEQFNAGEPIDKEHFGLYILVLQINKT